MARWSGEEAPSSTISGHGEVLLLLLLLLVGPRCDVPWCAVARNVKKTRQRIMEKQREMGRIMQRGFVEAMAELDEAYEDYENMLHE